tara:strand:+ start:146 stop:355 length:210 start_codon:yes stop_codon:yes gene_type:complete
MKITLDDNEYEVTEESSEELKGLVSLLTTSQNSLRLMEHITSCVSAVHKTKASELQTLLETNETESEQE